VLTEEARRRRKWIGEDLLFQSGPGKAINCLQPILDGGDLGGEVVKLFTAALTGQGGGRWQRQAVELVGVDQRKTGQHARVDPTAFGVALIVAAEIGDLLTVDQRDRNRLPRILDGDRKPGHASRLHHDLHLG